MKKVFSVLLCGLLVGCTSHVSQYENQAPEFDFIDYFTGEVDGWGVIYDWKGDIQKRFHILMTGTRQDSGSDKVMRLDEIFTYADGEVMKRYWDVTQTEEGVFKASAPEVDSKSLSGGMAGFAANIKYNFNLSLEGGKMVKVRMDDWMYMIDEDTVVNRNKIYKFGLKVGELNIFFRKRKVQ